jgi:hypothetical protein
MNEEEAEEDPDETGEKMDADRSNREFTSFVQGRSLT